jgi:hypothetical protein
MTKLRITWLDQQRGLRTQGSIALPVGYLATVASARGWGPGTPDGGSENEVISDRGHCYGEDRTGEDNTIDHRSRTGKDLVLRSQPSLDLGEQQLQRPRGGIALAFFRKSQQAPAARGL